MAERRPLAFMSYLRRVDEHDRGRLTELRKRLENEVWVYTGEDFPIFQDRNDVAWGQHWQSRIRESIDYATFLIPIITPGFFSSRYCRDEVEAFLMREKALRCSDLVLPIYYVDYPAFNDAQRRSQDPLMMEIANREYADWRNLRHNPFTSAAVRRKLSQLAEMMRDALNRRRRTAMSANRASAVTEPQHKKQQGRSWLPPSRIGRLHEQNDTGKPENIDRVRADVARLMLRAYLSRMHMAVTHLTPKSTDLLALKLPFSAPS